MPEGSQFSFSEMLERTFAIVAYYMTPIEQAKKLGTFGADDRSAQYPLRSNEELVKAVNLALTKARKCERLNDEKDVLIRGLKKKIERDRIVIAVLSSIITAIGLEGMKVLIAVLVR